MYGNAYPSIDIGIVCATKQEHKYTPYTYSTMYIMYWVWL